jgi:hypothetical protein
MICARQLPLLPVHTDGPGTHACCHSHGYQSATQVLAMAGGRTTKRAGSRAVSVLTGQWHHRRTATVVPHPTPASQAAVLPHGRSTGRQAKVRARKSDEGQRRGSPRPLLPTAAHGSGPALQGTGVGFLDGNKVLKACMHAAADGGVPATCVHVCLTNTDR